MPSWRRADVRPDVARMLATLPARQRTVIYLRFYQQMTQQEIGDRLGLSQVHISRLLRAALEALRVTHAEQRLIAERRLPSLGEGYRRSTVNGGDQDAREPGRTSVNASTGTSAMVVKERGRSEDTAEEIAARTVNKERARSGEARESSRLSTKDISSGRRAGCARTADPVAGRRRSCTTRLGASTSRAARR